MSEDELHFKLIQDEGYFLWGQSIDGFLIENLSVRKEISLSRGMITDVLPTTFDYDLENEKIFINNKLATDYTTEISQNPGKVKVRLTLDCNHFKDHNKKAKQFSCDCPTKMKSAEKEFEIVPQKQLLVKEITYSRQFELNEGWDLGNNSLPDIYFEIFGLSTERFPNYDLKKDGPIVIELNHEITITDQFYLLNFEIWDADHPSKDDLIQKVVIRAEDINNWQTGKYTIEVNRGFMTFDIERLN
jgi:hypothetical protein